MHFPRAAAVQGSLSVGTGVSQPPLANLTQLHTIMVGSVSQGQEPAPQGKELALVRFFTGGVLCLKSHFFPPLNKLIKMKSERCLLGLMLSLQ